MSEQQLTTTTDLVLAAELVEPEDSGMDLAAFGLGNVGPTINELELMQNSKVRGVPNGVFYDKNAKEVFETIKAIPVNFRQSRTCWPSGEIGSKPICKSKDGLFPILNNPNLTPQAKRCGYFHNGRFKIVCPKAQFHKINGRDIKPQCRQEDNIIFVNPETGMVYRLQTRRGGTKQLDELKKRLAQKMQAGAFQKRKVSPVDLVFEISIAENKKGSNVYYDPFFGEITKHGDPSLAEYATNIAQFLTDNGQPEFDDEDDENLVKDAVADGINDGRFDDDYQPSDDEIPF